MKLVTFQIDGQARPGRLAGDHIVDLGALAPDLRGISSLAFSPEPPAPWGGRCHTRR